MDIKLLVCIFSGNSLQFLEEFGDPQVPMWSNDNVVLDVEVITSIEDDEEPVYTDLNSHGSSGDDSDYGSGKQHCSNIFLISRKEDALVMTQKPSFR